MRCCNGHHGLSLGCNRAGKRPSSSFYTPPLSTTSLPIKIELPRLSVGAGVGKSGGVRTTEIPGRGAYLKNSVGPYLYRGPGKGFGTISLFKNTGKRRN